MAARQRAAGEVVVDGVGHGRPVGGVRPVARGASGDGDGLGGRGMPRPRPSREGVAIAGRIVQPDERAFDGVGGRVDDPARQRAVVEVVGDGVGDGRPVGGVRPVARGAPGNGDGHLRRGLPRPGPSGEGVAGAGRIDEREGRALDGVGVRVARPARQRAVVEFVRDGVGGGRPVRGVGLVARGALRDGDGLGGRVLPRPGPSREGVVVAGRVAQREGGGVDGVGGGVAAGVRAAVEVVVDAVGDERRRDVHVDVVRVGPASLVQVVAGRSAVLADGAALFVVEDDAGDGLSAGDGLGVVEVDGGAAVAGAAVQVALLAFEVIVAVVGRQGVGLAAGHERVGHPGRARLDVEAGDVVAVAAGVGVGFRLVEQVDVVAAGAGVEILVDDRPSQRLVLGLQFGRLGLVASDEHHVLDERRGPRGGGREEERRERGACEARRPGKEGTERACVHGVPPV